MSPTKDDIGTIGRTSKDDFSDAGVIIREVEEGTRCEECKNICGGYSPHEWRKTCQSCKCPREAHAIYQEQVTSVRERLGFKPENQTSRIDPRQLGYTWVPPGIMTSAKVQRYFDKIPQDKVPKLGTTGERYRERQITLQLPKQDLALDQCKHVEPQHCASYEDFVAARNEIALDIGYIKDAPQSTKCVNCDERIAKGDLAVIAPKFRDQMMWHPKCFSCSTCDELLVDLTYCVHEEKIYCERHYAELLKPRCNACDEHQQRQMLLSDDQSLKRLQDQIDSEIAEAANREAFGYNAMKDGVLYKDGFRIDPSEINDHEKSKRQVIGGSKTSLEREDRESSENVIKKTQELSSESDCKEEVYEEPCVKKHVKGISSSRQEIEERKTADDQRTNISQSIKTQIGQTNVEDYSTTSEIGRPQSSLRKSAEPFSTGSNQIPESVPAEEFSPLIPELSFDEYHREDPDGQDVPEPQFSDDYLRSLDGIKIRPLVRDDGSGRRRAFKKRRSSDSTSSRESRASREEELKMFTSLEEEEFESIRRGDSDYVPIRYSSDPNLIKTGKHQRRHKKSPIKDSLHPEAEESRSSLEMLDEENVSPWGEVKPEHYKDSEFWKREKAVSIEEESEENAQSWSTDIQRQQAGQATASPSPTKYIPKLSSFEEASRSQHENVASTLIREKSQEKTKNSTETEDVQNVSSDANFLPETLIASSDRETSTETEDQIACNKPDNQTERKGLRRSPRLDDMDHYEERLRDEENVNVYHALSPSAQPFENNDLRTSQLTEIPSELRPICSTDEQNLSAIATDEIPSSVKSDHLRGTSPRPFARPITPTIDIEPACDDMAEIASEPGLLEGISDFYDFNASINPSRSPSVEKMPQKSRSHSKSPFVRKSKSPSRISREPSNEPSELSDFYKDKKPIPGLSDFYDFNVMLNQQAYNYAGEKDRDTHRSTTDYLADQLKDNKCKSKSPAPISLSKNEVPCLPEEGGGSGSFKETPSPLDTPITPEYQRTLSANMRHIEAMRDEHIMNMYKRSRYVGESMEFGNDFEELRERTRRFRRSRSKSRSPLPDGGEPSTSRQAAARRELQDKILEEITRTTINYQDFSRDLNKPFLEFDRRGSDSALIQKPELMIQIEDECKEKSFYYDDSDELEGDDYHHFRRFSLNQELPTDEYLEDFKYVEEIDVQTKSGTRSWTRRDYCDPEVRSNPETNNEISSISVDITGEDSDRADDVDSESDDDRQTVVEVDDEIDEDIWDYERPEESNEQSECEEAEREMDRYADKSADDWNEDGAIGGVDDDFKEDTINIDEMYDDAVKNTEESGIEKDYDILVNSISDEENRIVRSSTDLSDSSSMKTEELLDEILREDEKRFKHWSPRRDKFESTRKFIEHESTPGGNLQNGVSSNSISSTRLRSRYGLAPSTAHRNFDSIDNVNVDLNYIPKKEYKWRKNFKLDDDDNDVSPDTSSSLSRCVDSTEDDENLSLFPAASEQCDSEENTKVIGSFPEEIFEENGSIKIIQTEEPCATSTTEICKETETSISERILSENCNDQEMAVSVESKPIQLDESTKKEVLCQSTEEVNIKKKKTKRKTRKASKGSIEEEAGALQIVEIGNVDSNELQIETGTKKKTKKKKKSITSPEIQTRSTSPTKDITNTINLKPEAKPKSPSPALNLSVLKSDKVEKQAPTKIEVPNSPIHLSTTPLQSKSKSPEPVKSTGPNTEPSGTRTSPKPPLERNDSTGVYELIKDGSMYPWF